jgi:hypothetical protein
MATELTTLRIKAEKLGTVTDVKIFLTDLENAYNSIYAFDFLVDSIGYDRERNIKLIDERFHRMREYWKEFSFKRDFPYGGIFFEKFFEDYIGGPQNTLPNLLELQSKIDIEQIVLPSDRLVISKVNIQSPGFWEFLGGLNPLQQIREYIKDRHERKKDDKYKSRQEEELGELEIEEKKNNIINQRIDMLKKAGYTKTEIRQLVTKMVITPLKQLNKHQDNGQIETIEEEYFDKGTDEDNFLDFSKLK